MSSLKSLYANILRRSLVLLFSKSIRRFIIRSKNHQQPPIAIAYPAPVIVIGMHRSGTTILSDILRLLGIEMGRNHGILDRESLFFQTLNKSIFQSLHGEWDTPAPVGVLKAGTALTHTIAVIISRICNSRLSFLHFGVRRLFQNRISQRWGWKDPRNTFTLPVWLDIFPDAKVIFIYRNGVDVAHSLVRRSFVNFSLRTTSMEGALSLWEEYNREAMEVTRQLDEKQLVTISYEELIRATEKTMEQLSAFLEIPIDDSTAKSILRIIREDRMGKAHKDPQLRDFIEKSQDNPMMKKLGYS